MDITGEYRIPAPRETVWQALNDPEILRRSITGCEDLTKHSDTELSAKVNAKVGPVKATFNGKVTLSNIDPPNGYTISGEGQGGVAGFAKGSADVKLTEDGSDTVLTYTAHAEVGGKLASVGSRLVQGVAKKTADDFFGKFSELVGGAQPVTAEPEAPALAAEPAAPVAGTQASPFKNPVLWVVGAVIVIAIVYLIVNN
jgi:hypothetical protein